MIKISKIINLFIIKLLPKMWAVKEMEYLPVHLESAGTILKCSLIRGVHLGEVENTVLFCMELRRQLRLR